MPAMLPNLPDLILEFAPTNTPLETAPTWVDISQYLRTSPQVATNRGRSREGVSFPHGTMTVTLSNRDRRFDPLFAAGPYFGNLKPRRQVRLRAVWSATSYTIFTGWVSGWPQDYGAGRTDAVVVVECVDALAHLADAGMSINLFDTVGSPVFHLSDFAGTTWVDRVGGRNAVPTEAPVDQPQPSMIPNTLAGKAVQTASGRGVRKLNTALTGYSAFTISFWIKVATTNTQIDNIIFGSGSPSVSVQLNGPTLLDPDALSLIQLLIFDAAANNVQMINLAAIIADGAAHCIAITVSSSFVVNVFVDGVLERSGSTSGTPALSVQQFASGATGSPAWDTGSVFVQEMVIWGSVLTAAQVAAWYQVGLGNIIESTSARCTRILDNVDWPAAWRTLPPASGLGVSRGECAAVQQTGYAINALQDVEASEQGRLFATKANFVTLQARWDAFETTRGRTVQAIFSDDGSDIAYQGFGWDFDDREILNDVTVDWSGGSQRSTDTASVTDVGRQSATINTVLSTAVQATDVAAGTVAYQKDAAMRTRGIRVNPAQGAQTVTQWPTVLGLEIGDRIQVEATPMGTGAQLSQTLTLEAIAWSISGDEWTVDLFGTPLPQGVFVLDTSLLDTGKLGF